MQRPPIETRDLDSHHAEFDLRIDGGLDCFRGHFPGEPILPGVVQIGWVVGLAAELFQVPDSVHELKKIKFNRVIRPGDPLHLRIDVADDRSRVRYTYSGDGEPYSSGELVMDGET